MTLNHRDTAYICQGLALLLHAGISLADGVYLLAEEGTHQGLLTQLGKQLDQGLPLSQAMAETAAFPRHVIAMTAIGEKAGRTEETLSSLADFYARREKTARLIRSALAYPAMLLLLMLTVITILLTKVLPVFDRVYASLGMGLTGMAGGLLRLGQGLQQLLPFLPGFLGLAAVLALVLARRPALREKTKEWLFSRFGDRGLFRKFNNAHFVQAMALALGSGLGVEDALAMSASLLSHIPQAARRCALCAEALGAGDTLAQALEKGALLSPSHSRMLALALRGGSGDQCLRDLAQSLSEDAEASLESTLSAVEPVLVLICSGLVGLIILSVMLPLSSLLSALG